MRWDSLFDDLEAQLERELAAEDGGVRAEEERVRIGRVTMRDRVRALVAVDANEPIRLRLRSGERLRVRVRALGADWLSGDLVPDGDGPASSAVIPLASIAALTVPVERVRVSLAPPSRPEKGLTARLPLPIVLRDLARRRVGVEVGTAAGVLAGTLDRVTADALDLALHPADLPRRGALVRAVDVIPLSEVLLVRIP